MTKQVFKSPNARGKGNYPQAHARGTGDLIGKSQCYVYYIQREKPALYSFYIEYGNGEFIKGFNKFKTDMEELIEKAVNIQYFLKENRNVMKINEWLDMQKEFKHGSIYRVMRTNSVASKPTEYMKAFKELTSNEKLNKQVEEWLETFDKQ